MSRAAPVLVGYCHSVYTRAARIALIEKGVACDYREHDPFSGRGADNPHPFGRVPVLLHAGFTLYETAAITAYVDAAFDGPRLMPDGAGAAARAVQVISMVDAYVYWPLVRQVYSHGAFRPAMGEAADGEVLAAGLREAPRVLAALEAIAAEGLVLGQGFTRADCHLAPMIAAFVQVPEAARMLGACPALGRWWARVAERPAMKETQTPLPSGAARR